MLLLLLLTSALKERPRGFVWAAARETRLTHGQWTYFIGKTWKRRVLNASRARFRWKKCMLSYLVKNKNGIIQERSYFTEGQGGAYGQWAYFVWNTWKRRDLIASYAYFKWMKCVFVHSGVNKRESYMKKHVFPRGKLQYTRPVLIFLNFFADMLTINTLKIKTTKAYGSQGEQSFPDF